VARSRRNRGREVAPLPQRVGDDPRHVRNAAERRRDAVAIDDRPPERAGIDAGRAERSRESDPRNRMDGNQLVAERDAPVLERRIDAHALELPEAEEMGDALAHLEHRERRACGRLDERRQHRIGRLAPLGDKPYGSDHLPEVIGDRG